jgi:hypothetical protein
MELKRRFKIWSIIPLATEGSILFAWVGWILTQDNANLFFDDSNNNLGIGINTPNTATKLHAYEATAAANVRIETWLAASNASFRLINTTQHWNFQLQWDAGLDATDRFVIKNVTDQTEPFTLEAWALDNSIYVDITGVWILTDTPLSPLHVAWTARIDTSGNLRIVTDNIRPIRVAQTLTNSGTTINIMEFIATRTIDAEYSWDSQVSSLNTTHNFTAWGTTADAGFIWEYLAINNITWTAGT